MSADLARQALAATLDNGARSLGLSLSAAQCALLLAHLKLVAQWSRTYNLTAVRDPEAMLGVHLLDSLAASLPLRRVLGERGASVLDVGSGAGFPGIPLAIAQADLRVTCMDAVAKKASFVRHVVAELSLEGVSALHSRVEIARPQRWDAIVSRAFASLADFIRLTRHLLAPGGVWMAMKGHVHQDELAALPADIEVFHVEPLSVPTLDATRSLVWMKLRQAVA